MKKIISVVLAITVMIFSLVVFASAHPGRTDSNGGHYNRDTGEYHYHHGYPEHQHPNGVCPYNYKNAETDKKASSKNHDKNDWVLYLIGIPIYLLILFGIPFKKKK